jgi:hypothetical protein
MEDENEIFLPAGLRPSTALPRPVLPQPQVSATSPRRPTHAYGPSSVTQVHSRTRSGTNLTDVLGQRHARSSTEDVAGTALSPTKITSVSSPTRLSPAKQDHTSPVKIHHPSRVNARTSLLPTPGHKPSMPRSGSDRGNAIAHSLESAQPLMASATVTEMRLPAPRSHQRVESLEKDSTYPSATSTLQAAREGLPKSNGPKRGSMAPPSTIIMPKSQVGAVPRAGTSLVPSTARILPASSVSAHTATTAPRLPPPSRAAFRPTSMVASTATTTSTRPVSQIAAASSASTRRPGGLPLPAAGHTARLAPLPARSTTTNSLQPPSRSFGIDANPTTNRPGRAPAAPLARLVKGSAGPVSSPSKRVPATTLASLKSRAASTPALAVAAGTGQRLRPAGSATSAAGTTGSRMPVPTARQPIELLRKGPSGLPVPAPPTGLAPSRGSGSVRAAGAGVRAGLGSGTSAAGAGGAVRAGAGSAGIDELRKRMEALQARHGVSRR